MADDVRTRLAELEGLDEDLFDFPDVQGMSDLIAAARESAAAGPSAPLPAAAPAAPAPKARTAEQPQSAPSAPKPAEPRAPLPSAPIASSDLDEDLFGFGELMDLGASATFGTEDPLLDPDPLADLAPEPWALEPEPAAPKKTEPKKVAEVAPAPPVAPAAKVADVEPAKPAERAPAPPAETPTADDAAGARERKPKNKKAAAKPTVVMREKKAPEAKPAEAAPEAKPKSAVGQGALLTAFPDAIDLPPARSKMLWVLVGCFLLVNGMIFLITQQQSQSVNKTLAAVTSTLADAIARGAQPQVPANASQRDPSVAYEPERTNPTSLDPATYSNTHEVALEIARRLIQSGEYTRARRNLFTVLANQDRGTPLTKTLREEIDYLIALTYYDQGLSIAQEESR